MNLAQKSAPTSLDARRAEALVVFRGLGLPHRRIEEWKYTDLRNVLGEAGAGTASAQWRIGKLPAGVERFDLSQENPPDWVAAYLGASAMDAMSAASLALSEGGVALRVAKDAAIAAPFKLDFTGGGHLRALLVLEEGASLTLVEGAGDAAFRNVGFEIQLKENAVLTHVRVAPASAGSVLVEEAALRIARGARYHAHFANFGAKLSRFELNIALEGEGAEAHLSGASVLHDRHADVTTHVEHLAGRTQSSQLFKLVAGGKGRAVYQGKVTVAKGANGADSRQTAKALLLGPRAEADLKPELEILADDVKCAHGAAVGDLDAESLFYLRSRGIPEAEARRLLIRAFLEEAAAGIENEEIRLAVWKAVEAALQEASS